MKQTPITQLIEFINNIGVSNEPSDEVKNALSELGVYITEKALELQKEEATVIKEAFNEGAELVYDNFNGELYYNETFGALPVAPVMMNQEEFDKYMEGQEKVKED